MHADEGSNTVSENMVGAINLIPSLVCPQFTEKSGVEVTKTLPDDMVEKILAMVPFPSVYKARCLAKSWKARFSAISSQHDEAVKFLAIGFQKQVSEWSHKWDTFCPVVIAKEDSFAFNLATHTWKRMPSLSFLPEHSLRMHRQMEGPLLLASESCGHKPMYVANVLTRRWKPLPLCPLNPLSNGSVCSNYAFCVKLVVNSSLQTYQVIRFCRPCVLPNCLQCSESLYGSSRLRVCSVQVYDSQSEIWTSKELVLPGQFGCRPYELARSVCLNGIIYMVASLERENILGYSVEKGSFQRLSMLHGSIHHTGSCVHLKVCDDTLLMVVTYGFPVLPTHVVLKIDLESQKILVVARGPPAGVLIRHAPFTEPVGGHGSCIFFGVNDNCAGSTILVYNLAQAQWRLITSLARRQGKRDRPIERGMSAKKKIRRPSPPFLNYLDGINSSFQPGLLPFMEV